MSPFTPKLLVCLREGYTKQTFLSDLIAGLTVGIVALPLAMAFGIASLPHFVVEQARTAGYALSPPAGDLYTSIVADFISGIALKS